MKSVSRSELRDNLKKYFDLADNECLIIHKGVKKAYILMPFSSMDETEFLKLSATNIAHLKKGIKEFNRDEYYRSNFKRRINIHFTFSAFNDYQHWRDNKDKRVMAHIHRLLNEISIHPEEGSGSPRLLKAEFAGFWSRSINNEHRIVYKKKPNGDIVIISMCYQYEK